jgi:hypothetical protein
MCEDETASAVEEKVTAQLEHVLAMNGPPRAPTAEDQPQIVQ